MRHKAITAAAPLPIASDKPFIPERGAKELHLSIKAKRPLTLEESEMWELLKNKEKTLNELAKGFEDVIKKSGLAGFEILVKVKFLNQREGERHDNC